ncbi:hypothetical protein K7G92_000210 [Pasteurella canis]|uniref:Membrane protein n=1 Tax=Pasteurella canis TaxID=753 RepID=A0A379ESK3_9PAST|nr:hypothetical protein [Pasteurella canis]MXN89558.1 hypothetical protein [Pasteurella canis]UAX42401.1 hypothetical protein K7G89_000202 [Pasteurella canis]UEA17049.1 hypothetical protein K7G92_000210 [Pasteurella canis]SUC09039.1 membrane protein [Pasteurella canis]
MKLTKLLVGLMVVGGLTACSQNMGSDMKMAEKKAMEMKVSEPTFETAAYFCDVKGKRNQVVSVTYAFVDGKADSATVSINRKVVGDEMKLDSAYKDGTRFVEGNKVWSLDEGFTAKTVNTTVPVMFTDNNKILARNCDIAK